MNPRHCKCLPHEIPLWVDPHKETYFTTINCQERDRNQLTLPDVAERLFETVRYRQEKFLWWPYVFLLMPDFGQTELACRQQVERMDGQGNRHHLAG